MKGIDIRQEKSTEWAKQEGSRLFAIISEPENLLENVLILRQLGYLSLFEEILSHLKSFKEKRAEEVSTRLRKFLENLSLRRVEEKIKERKEDIRNKLPESFLPPLFEKYMEMMAENPEMVKESIEEIKELANTKKQASKEIYLSSILSNLSF